MIGIRLSLATDIPVENSPDYSQASDKAKVETTIAC